jgi:hypothetical protein
MEMFILPRISITLFCVPISVGDRGTVALPSSVKISLVFIPNEVLS